MFVATHSRITDKVICGGKKMNLNSRTMKTAGQFAGVVAAAAASTAFAADLPARTMVAAPPMMVPNWQGLFVGGSLGGSWLNSSIDDTAYNPVGYGVSTGSRSEANSVGVLGGLQVGYNLQSRNFVYGVQADLSWLGGAKSSVTGSQNTSAGYYGGYAGQTTKTSRLSALGTVRARAGIDFGGTLPYITGGVAFGQIKNSYSYNGYFGQGSSSTKSWTPGFVIGAGIEHMLTEHVSVVGEVLWVKFRDKSVAGPNLGYGGNNGSVQFSNQAAIARAGLNYRF